MAISDEPDFIILKDQVSRLYETLGTQLNVAEKGFVDATARTVRAEKLYEELKVESDRKWDGIRSTIAMLLSIGGLIFGGAFAYQILKVDDVRQTIADSEETRNRANLVLENIFQMYEATSSVINAKKILSPQSAGLRRVKRQGTPWIS
jgi:hypothetical protein